MDEAIDWSQCCPFGVIRSLAAQHFNCATCKKLMWSDSNGESITPRVCMWYGWEDPFDDGE